MTMHPLIDHHFRNVAVIKTRPGIMPNKFMINGLCWMCATAGGCEGNCSPHGYHFDYYTCPSCRRMVPWSSGGTDSLDCADCWALTEGEKTMEEKTEVAGQQSAEPPTIKQNIGPAGLISMKTFAIDGPELLPRGGTWALKHACELADVIGDNSREIFMLTRKDFTQGNQEVPFVVVVSQKASKEEAISAFKRAIEILEKPPEANPEPTKGWVFPNDGLARTEPARAVGSELAVGTIRGSKIKSGTKALEKIVARQEKRIEELAMQVGKLESINRDNFQVLDDVLKAAGANGISQVLSILVAVKSGKPVPEVAEMPEFSSRSTTFYMTKP
jgi:hypothetical protein